MLTVRTAQSQIYIHKQQSICFQHTVVMITHTCTSKHVHTLSLDSPVYTISHEDKHACTNRASLRIALYRSSETQTAIRLNPIYTRQSQGCACKHACTHTHTHTHSFYENCIVSSSYTQMAISLDPVYTSQEDVCVHTHTYSFCMNCIVSSSYTQMAISLDPAYTSRS